jgi:predicted RNase H-like HicB family nuclease
MRDIRHVQVSYDPEARVWWAESDDLPGLVSEAPTLDALIDRVTAVAGELLSANGAAPGVVSLEFSTTREVQAA